MSKLNKPIKRETDSDVFERGQHRNIIVSMEPVRNGALVGFRIKGTRDTYRLPVGSLFIRALEHHQQKIERHAKALVKSGKCRTLRGARAQAVKDLKDDLR